MNAGSDETGRFQRGMALLERIGGEGFDGPLNSLAAACPDLARLMVEFPYGDVLSRPGLDLRQRQICTVSSLLAQGSAQPQLKFHMGGLLNVGGRVQDLVEILFIATAVVGFPAAIDAIGIVRRLIAERDIAFAPEPPVDDDGRDRYGHGLEAFRSLMLGPDQPDALVAALGAISPELGRWTIEFAFGEVLSRTGLEARVRQLAVISMLATLGNRTEALRLHLQGAAAVGATRTEILEALIQTSVYAGFPAALNAFTIARAVFENLPSPAADTAAAVVSSSIEPSEHRRLRRQRGETALAGTSGASGEAVLHGFDDIAPEIGRMILEHSYGDIFSRPGIDAKTRELTACAALAARGTAATETPLRVHVNAALTAGASRQEIIETLLNMLPYGGYPAVQRAMQIAGEEVAKRSPPDSDQDATA